MHINLREELKRMSGGEESTITGTAADLISEDPDDLLTVDRWQESGRERKEREVQPHRAHLVIV